MILFDANISLKKQVNVSQTILYDGFLKLPAFPYHIRGYPFDVVDHFFSGFW